MRLFSDHAPLSINIPIIEEIIHTSKLTIIPKSNQETEFIKDVISSFKLLETTNIEDTDKLEQVVNQLSSIVKQAWSKNAKKSKISKHSKQWWLDSCSWALHSYRTSRSRENWKTFNQSQTTRIASFLATTSNFMMKSTVRCVHGFSGISLNFNFPAISSILFFILWHKSHPSTYLPMSLVTPGH